MVEFTLNGVPQKIDVEADTPLLWVLRDELGLVGTKFGCGIGQCGSCTVHLDGVAARTCILPVGSVAGRTVTTIEGLSERGDHPVQRAWVEGSVPQCGYCQSGQVMSAAALLAEHPEPTPEHIESAMTNICRCGTYDRIRKAIRRASELAKTEAGETR